MESIRGFRVPILEKYGIPIREFWTSNSRISSALSIWESSSMYCFPSTLQASSRFRPPTTSIIGSSLRKSTRPKIHWYRAQRSKSKDHFRNLRFFGSTEDPDAPRWTGCSTKWVPMWSIRTDSLSARIKTLGTNMLRWVLHSWFLITDSWSDFLIMWQLIRFSILYDIWDRIFDHFIFLSLIIDQIFGLINNWSTLRNNQIMMINMLTIRYMW